MSKTRMVLMGAPTPTTSNLPAALIVFLPFPCQRLPVAKQWATGTQWRTKMAAGGSNPAPLWKG